MEVEEGDVVKLTKALDKLNASVERMNSESGGARASAVINTNGMYISVTCVLILLIICLFQNRDITEMQRRYERMQDYLNVIYMQAPYLKPKEEHK